jgi:large subunit ribosomal protein L25
VPVHVSGDIAAGGLLDQQLTTLSVSADATKLPSGFEVSIAELEIGGAIHAKEVELPSGTELVTDGDAVVVHILAAPTAEEMEADLDITGAEEPTAPAAEAAGEGDVVPDTGSGEGGPAQPSPDAADAEG